MTRRIPLTVLLLVAAGLAACAKTPPVSGPPAPEPFPMPTATRPTSTPAPGREVPPAPPVIPVDQPVSAGDPLLAAAVEAINKDSPLKPVFFALDSDVLDDVARKTMASNAEVLKKYGTWVITIEGHCDERGTAEYNLALGDRRALAAKNYLVTLGIAADRVRTVSFGNEFPFDPGHDEQAWKLNRRAHFMLTSK